MRESYAPPTIMSEDAFEASALACGKTNPPPPGSFHFTGYDYISGHFGPGFGGLESESGSVGWPGPPASYSYPFSGLCINWVTLAT